ncbi:hypothetical protein jhhlp_005229 [Lomentospora prolificans]|uniref:Uncharacterized protein n=1 Tax=Lomentospora prolificans TaxID=41688 RepID=A0A2N3N771_9PEZI|nr:hypothetical protein jhhlp_005229 [Lomentospora prolificans]
MAENNDGRPASVQGERPDRVSMIGEGKLWSLGQSSTARDTMDETKQPAPTSESLSKDEGPPVTNTVSRLSRVSQKSHKSRKSGGFLLQDAVAEPKPTGESPPHRKRHPRRLFQSIRPKSSRAHEKSTSATSREGLGIATDQEAKRVTPSHQKVELKVMKTRGPSKEPPAQHERAKPDRPSLDDESAQILDMALRVSQSRRIASQRPVSQQLPPRLSPLPDTTGVSSLRQHLLQQRKISRTGSPRPDRSMPRNASGLRHAFESFDVTAPDGGYRYHVSRSTLARVQKAKDYIELMAQYRRLLEHVPPLRATGTQPPPTAASMHSSPQSSAVYTAVGRQYNPLQYIRNRKVRARERQAIDGETQGFNDVDRVTSWIDEIESISKRNSEQSNTTNTIAVPLLPVYLGAAVQTTNTSAALTSSNTSKPNRPRVDWFIEPAEMIADVYWLEQGSNKLLIEDRHWSRLYPRGSELEVSLRNNSHHSEDVLSAISRPATRERTEDSTPDKPPDPTPPKVETEPLFGSPREHSRLHPGGLYHHRHNSSLHSNHEFFGPPRGSTSDLSDSDNDYKDSRFRSGTITGTSKDILAKQMMEMIAKEEKDIALKPVRSEASKYPPVSYRTPEKAKDPASKPPSRLHSRQNSFNNASDLEENMGSMGLRVHEPYSSLRNRRPQRPRLDVPVGSARQSLEIERTAPNSPEPVPSRDSYLDISPLPSRGGSPTRNPFTKVKHIFRDQGKDKYAINVDDKNCETDVDADLSRWASGPFTQSEKRSTSLERRFSSSSNNRPQVGKVAQELSKGHHRLPSVKVKADEVIGIRGLLKAPGARIDTVLRSGVSKLGDIIWKKETDPSNVALSEECASSDSESDERGRGRHWSRPSRDESTGIAKPYLSQMPEFHHAGRATNPVRASGVDVMSDTRGSRRPSMQSGGFSDATTQQASQNRSLLSPDEQSDPFAEHNTDQMVRAHDKRLTAMLAVPPSFNSSRHYSSMSRNSDSHWSMTMRSRSPEQHAPTSRREIARIRALLLSSGVMAMEIARRANRAHHLPVEKKPKPDSDESDDGNDVTGINWPELASLSGDKVAFASQTVAPADMFTFAGGILNNSIQTSTDQWQRSADQFTNKTSPSLHADLEALRIRVGVDLSSMARVAADDADEASREVSQRQRLKVKRVVDVIEKMLRRRRRRFRWVRRAMWLGVEWVLVGFMWYVWFVVMMLRGILGIGTGTIKVVKWLLWL